MVIFSCLDLLLVFCLFLTYYLSHNLLPFTYEVRMFIILSAELPKSGIGVSKPVVASAR